MKKNGLGPVVTLNDLPSRVARSLLVLRLGVFVVMLMWTLDKFVNPAHTAKVFDGFYGIGGAGHDILMALGSLEMLLLLLFVGGIWRRFSYGAVLILHAVSTFSAYQQYLDPFNNLLFFAAWPMLAASITLYWLRDWDTLGVVK
jgi:putative oxidoreductase